MKQQVSKTYSTELIETGTHQTISAKVVATMNYSYKRITDHPLTDFTKNVAVQHLHKVESFVNGELWQGTNELKTEEKVLEISEQMIKDTKMYINALSNKEPEIPFEDKMNMLFKNK